MGLTYSFVLVEGKRCLFLGTREQPLDVFSND